VVTCEYLQKEDRRSSCHESMRDTASRTRDSNGRGEKQEVRPRAVLSKEQAIEIFQCKNDLGNQSMTATSIALANKYNVSAKTIRDIWSGKSWFEATFPHRQEVSSYTQKFMICLAFHKRKVVEFCLYAGTNQLISLVLGPIKKQNARSITPI
jgi:hypothetical protein